MGLHPVGKANRLIAKNKDVYINNYLFDLISKAKDKGIEFNIISSHTSGNYAEIAIQVEYAEWNILKFDNTDSVNSEMLLFKLEKEEGLWKIADIYN